MRKMLAVLMLFPFAALLHAETMTGTVTTEVLNVRIKPGLEKNNSVVASLKKGDQIKVLRELKGWLEIQIPESAAVWVHGSYLKNDVVQKEIRLRSGPGVAYAPYAVNARPGQKLEIIRKSSDDWVKIKPPTGLTAWVSAEFVKLPEPAKAENVDTKPEDAAKSAAEDKKSVEKPVEKPAETAVEQPVKKENDPSAKKETAGAPVEKTPQAPAKTEKAESPAEKPAEPAQGDSAVKTVSVTREGFILSVKSDLEDVTHALATREKGQYTAVCYLRSSKAKLDNWLNRKVKVTGYDSEIPGWKHPILEVESITPCFE